MRGRVGPGARFCAAPSAGAGGSRRSFTRGRPYSPVGTVQDFTGSPHHAGLADLQRELDEMTGRAPSHLYEGPTVTTATGPRPLFERDMREDPQNNSLPEHVIAARQRMMAMQSDSYGEAVRGIVAPPPPQDVRTPQAYRPRGVELGDQWWMAMALIALVLFLMARFGK